MTPRLSAVKNSKGMEITWVTWPAGFVRGFRVYSRIAMDVDTDQRGSYIFYGKGRKVTHLRW